MTKISMIAAALLTVAALPVHAAGKVDCDGDFKAHMAKMSTYVDSTIPATFAEALRRSLNAYDSCKAGDSFSPHGVWDQVIADLGKK